MQQTLADKDFRQHFRLGKNFEAIYFEKHLYQPLLYLDAKEYRDIIQLRPVALNEGEKRFVEDLRRFYALSPTYFVDKEIYLLRNKSKSGISFFNSNGGFSPDFILWLFVGDYQHICFIDPKGFNYIGSLENEKVKLNENLKKVIEPVLDDSTIRLHSFLVSVTELNQIIWRQNLTLQDFNENNIYFQKEQQEEYVKLMLEKIILQV